MAKPWKDATCHWRALILTPFLLTLCWLTWPALPTVSVDVHWPQERESLDSISHLLNLPAPLGTQTELSRSKKSAELLQNKQAAGNTPAGIQKQQADDEDRRRRPAGEGREDVTLRGRMRGPGGMRAADREFRVLPLTVKAMAVASAYRVGDSSFVVMGEYLTPVLAHHLKRALVDECAWEGESGDRAVTAAEFLWLRKEDYHGKPWAPVMIRCTFARPVGSDNNGGSLLLRRRGTEEPRAIVKKFPLVLQEVEMEVLREEPGAFELIKRPPLYELAHCSGPLYGHLRPRAVSDWLHYHSHAVGVQHFFLHDFGAISGDYAATSEETAAPSAEKLAPAGGGAEASAASGVSGARAADTREEEPSLAEVVAPFKARGLVTVTRLLGHERFRSHYWHQILTQNDCLYRARFTARWLIFTDMDEYIFTPPPASLSSALAALARSSHAWASMGAYWGFITRCRVKVADDTSNGSSSSSSSSDSGSSGNSGSGSGIVSSGSSSSSGLSTSRGSRELMETAVGSGEEEVNGYEAQGLREKELLVGYLPMRSRLPICSSLNYSEPATINTTKAFFCPEHFGRRKVVVDPRRIDQVTVHEVLLPGNASGEVWDASYEAGMPVIMHYRGILNQEKMPRCVRVRVEETVGSNGEGEQLNVIDFTFSDYVRQALAVVSKE